MCLVGRAGFGFGVRAVRMPGQAWRAAGSVGLPIVPCMVVEMGDNEVFELMMVENLQRAELTAMEEAQGYKRMLDLRDEEGKPLHTVASLAAKIGRTVQHVGDRLALCRLAGTPAGDALEAGEINITHARLLARIPGTKIRFGLDGVIGFIPGIGDVLGGLASCIIVLAAYFRGAPLVTVEAMKMEHTLTAPYEGTVVRIAFGLAERVAAGAILVELAPLALQNTETGS